MVQVVMIVVVVVVVVMLVMVVEVVGSSKIVLALPYRPVKISR